MNPAGWGPSAPTASHFSLDPRRPTSRWTLGDCALDTFFVNSGVVVDE